MKILFIVRHTFYSVQGGDTVQAVETARHLKELGIDAEIKLCSEKMDYSRYSLIHFFNITRPADMLYHIKRSKKPYLVSSIYIDYAMYDKAKRKGLAGFIFRFFSSDGIEYLKTVYRFLTGADKLATVSYLWKGHKKSVKQVLNNAACVLVHAPEEFRILQEKYNALLLYHVVYNGIDTNLFKPATEFKDKNMILCAARFEGIKNQLTLIRALRNTKYRLVLIGNAAPGQKEYYKLCQKEAAGNISFIPHLPQHELIAYYTKAKVHVLPSFFEVCGLSSLEAAAMGCNIVITNNGYARHYFGGDAFYCEPGSTDSILKAVENAAREPVPPSLQAKVRERYTWKQTAQNLHVIYTKYLQ